MIGEWIDKEPRADGKPRQWKPSEIITVDPSRVIFQEGRREQHPLDNTQPYAHTRRSDKIPGGCGAHYRPRKPVTCSIEVRQAIGECKGAVRRNVSRPMAKN